MKKHVKVQYFLKIQSLRFENDNNCWNFFHKIFFFFLFWNALENIYQKRVPKAPKNSKSTKVQKITKIAKNLKSTKNEKKKNKTNMYKNTINVKKVPKLKK